MCSSPKVILKSLPGLRFGIKGLRELTGISDRPLVLNMIKPCTGFSPQVGADIFRQTALGGVDFIKDDELLGNPSFCPAIERVKAYNQAARQVFEQTGQKTRYIVNATERADRLLDHVKRLVDAGAEMLMLNFATVGYSMFRAIAQTVDIPVMGHYAGSGMFYEGAISGMSSPIALGKLPRLCGADIVIDNTPYGRVSFTTLEIFTNGASTVTAMVRHTACNAFGGGRRTSRACTTLYYRSWKRYYPCPRWFGSGASRRRNSRRKSHDAGD